MSEREPNDNDERDDFAFVGYGEWERSASMDELSEDRNSDLIIVTDYKDNRVLKLVRIEANLLAPNALRDKVIDDALKSLGEQFPLGLGKYDMFFGGGNLRKAKIHNPFAHGWDEVEIESIRVTEEPVDQ